LQEQEAGMIEKTDDSDKNDYSCEIVSFVVLVILSALSHFWFILIGAGVAIVFWAALALLGRLVRSAASALPWRPRAKQTNY
jgi:energy-coupling factor transporter transmembrane protein EcfT